MLKISAVQEKEIQRKYCELVKIPYEPDYMCYAAFDDHEFVGISVFSIKEKSCIIHNITLLPEKQDYLATYLLAKAPMNFADLCGIKTAIFSDSDIKLAKELGFCEKDGLLTVNLEGYFTTPCSKNGCGCDE